MAFTYLREGVEFRVNTATPGEQSTPSIAALSDGGYIITWTSDLQDGSGYGIYAQRYDSSGTPVGGETQINTTTAGGQDWSDVTAVEGGGYVITWSSNGQDGSSEGIYAQLYDSSGAAVGVETRVNSTTANTQTLPVVAPLQSGGYVITWESNLQDGSGYGIYAQAYNADGTTSGTEFRVNTTTANGQIEPAIAGLADGGYIVTWYSLAQDGGPDSFLSYGVYAQRYSSSGTPVGGQFLVNATTSGDQAQPAVAALPDGGYVITWTSFGQDGSGWGIYAQIYSADGTRSGSEFRVNSTVTDYQVTPEVAALEGGGFAITWTSNLQDGSGYGVYAQAYDSAGATIGSETQVNTFAANDQAQPFIAALAGGGYVITWTSILEDGSVSGVYAQSFWRSTVATDGPDTLHGSDGPNVIDGLGGDDIISGHAGNDMLQGGAGEDLIFGGLGNDTIYGDDLNGLDWADNTLYGEGGDDTIYGGYGTDTIYGGDGNDTLYGDGHYTSEASDSYAAHSVNDYLYGGDGNDTIYGSGQIEAGAGNDHIYADDGDDFILGGTGDDVIYAGGGDDYYIDGGGGNDQIFGGAGDDYIDNNSGDDFIDGGEGVDTLSFATQGFGVTFSLAITGPQSAAPFFGFDTVTGIEDLEGTVGNDRLTGDSHANELIGLEGDDVLDGGAGDDTLTGGAGADTFVHRVGGGFDVITDFTPGDTISLSGFDPAVVISVLQEGSDVIVDFTLSWDVILLDGIIVRNATVADVQAALMSRIEGTENADTLNGSSIGDIILGFGGNDILNGYAGNDVLNGGTGADTMSGGDGNDSYYVDNVGDQVLESANGGIDVVYSSVSYTLKSRIENLVLTGSSAINATGSSLDNIITGNSGNNVIDGGGGADTMSGGDGNDSYYVDNAGDQIQESASGGTDLVYSSISYTLKNRVENLTLIGNGAINATGSSLDNAIKGNSADNVIDGGIGADTMTGGAGNDTYYVDNSGDKVTELVGGGTDLVYSTITYTLKANTENLTLIGKSAINAYGNALDNILTGNSADNALDGSTGADRMIGGAGNDVYYVDNAGDSVVEGVGKGTDTVKSAISYTLGENVESLTLTGTNSINGTGNALTNVIKGNSGNNVIDGGAGSDKMAGGAGNDIYHVDNSGDTVTESAGSGIDLVSSSVGFTLGANIENLVLTGTNAINGKGNGLDNFLTGNEARNVLTGLDGADLLDGGAGKDTLNGGTGADVFLFSTALGSTNVDTIGDFNAAEDHIVLARSIFSGLAAGPLSGSAFFAGSNAHDADDRIIYDQASGKIYYDADGNGAGAKVLFAQVTAGMALAASDFSVAATLPNPSDLSGSWQDHSGFSLI